MSTTTNDAQRSGNVVIDAVPKGPLTPKQQIEALKRAQDAVNQRVRLGMQIYRAAEAHTTHQQSLLDQCKSDQQRLKKELQEDIARSLNTYDQWVGKIDEDFTTAMQNLEQRIDDLQHQWAQSQTRMDQMIRRSEALLDQTRAMAASAATAISSVERKAASPSQTRPTDK